MGTVRLTLSPLSALITPSLSTPPSQAQSNSRLHHTDQILKCNFAWGPRADHGVADVSSLVKTQLRLRHIGTLGAISP